MIKKLDVIYNGWGNSIQYGTLAYDEKTRMYFFEFTSEAMESGIELSPFKFRLGSGTFWGNQLPGFISDSLPDGWGKLLIDRVMLKEFNLPSYQITDLQRLALVGNHSIGALSFEPSKVLEQTDSENMDLFELANQVHDVVMDKDVDALRHLAVVGGSPHGARPKAMVRYDANTGIISTDVKAKGIDWLIKFPAQNEHPEVCALEDLYADFARESGVFVPCTKYFEINKQLSAFGVERFDRTKGGERIPLLTVAGALDMDFRSNFIDYRDFLRLTRLVTSSVAEVYEAYLRCVFNVVFNNRDDHMKNFSFIMDANNQWKISPGYDLTFNTGPNGHHQMSVMGETLYPDREALSRLAIDSNIEMKKCNEIIERVNEAASSFRSRALNHGGIRKSTVLSIEKMINNNLSRL